MRRRVRLKKIQRVAAGLDAMRLNLEQGDDREQAYRLGWNHAITNMQRELRGTGVLR